MTKEKDKKWEKGKAEIAVKPRRPAEEAKREETASEAVLEVEADTLKLERAYGIVGDKAKEMLRIAEGSGTVELDSEFKIDLLTKGFREIAEDETLPINAPSYLWELLGMKNSVGKKVSEEAKRLISKARERAYRQSEEMAGNSKSN